MHNAGRPAVRDCLIAIIGSQPDPSGVKQHLTLDLGSGVVSRYDLRNKDDFIVSDFLASAVVKLLLIFAACKKPPR